MTEQDVLARSDCSTSNPWTKRLARWAVWVLLTGTILYLGSVISSTQEKVKLANERNFRIIHGSPIATVMCDEEGKIVEYNRAAEELLGWTRDEMMGRHVNSMIVPRQRSVHDRSFAKAVEALRSVDEDWRVTKVGLLGDALTKDGKEVAVSFATRGIRYGGKIEFLAFLKKDVPPPVVPKVEQGPLELPKKTVP